MVKKVLSAQKITKRYTHPNQIEILKSISFDLHAGESLAIMGPSGEGKTTLLHILGTLEAPTSGSLEIAGRDITKHPPSQLRNQHIGFIFQGYNLLEDYTALNNVLMPALIAGKSIKKGSSAHQFAKELLCRVGLEKRMHFPAKLLSGGEKQRVAIARALCNDPDIILADEPSGNLDHTTSDAIHELLLYCVEALQKSLILVTHNQALAALCAQTRYLFEGELK